MDIPTLETDRLILRGFRADDMNAYATMAAHPDVSRFMSAAGQPMTRLEAWRHMSATVGHWHLRGFGMWALEEKSSGAFVGRAGLYFPETWPGREVGYGLARDYWGKGYATEAVARARDYAFETLGWDEIISLIDPVNERSIGVATRIGETFKEEWTVRDTVLHIYALSRADWEKMDR